MVFRSIGSGFLIAALFIAYQGVRGHLDVEAAVFGVVFGALSGTLDYLRNRKRSRNACETGRSSENTTGG